MIIADTIAIIAAFNPREAEHRQCRAELLNKKNRFVASAMILAEVDYLAVEYLGYPGAIRLLKELTTVASVAVVDDIDTREAITVAETYADMKIGLTAACTVILADRYKTRDIFSLDAHYRVIQSPAGTAFRLLPADRL